MKCNLALLLAFVTTPALPADMRAVNDQLDVIVQKMKDGDLHAVEYRKARRVHSIDVDGDGVPDTVVFFTIEGFAGGNNYTSYMTVFKGQGTRFEPLDTIVVGGKGLGAVSYSKPVLRNGHLVVERMEYVDSDARCCPSRKTSVTISIRDGKLIEVRSNP